MANGPAAVLFDMDGTLVDSEKLWAVALTELADAIGGALSTSARTAIIGTAMTRAVQILHSDLGAEGRRDGAADIAWLEDRVRFLIGVYGVAWRPGARELLDAVRGAGLPTALVTSSARPVTESALRAMGSGYFDVVVTRDDVTRPKPDAQPYLRAAALLGVPAAACVAVEDSAAGVTSAHAAGAAVLAISSGQDLPAGAGIHRRADLVGVGVSYLAGLSSAVSSCRG
jgi:HAD superfamily hydrolase (TIGR01509 family)